MLHGQSGSVLWVKKKIQNLVEIIILEKKLREFNHDNKNEALFDKK
jgi:hypothetical protein